MDKSRLDSTDILCSHGFIYIYALLDQYSKFIEKHRKDKFQNISKKEIQNIEELYYILEEEDTKKHFEVSKEFCIKELGKIHENLEKTLKEIKIIKDFVRTDYRNHFYFEDKNYTTHLIGENVIAASKKEGLGYYGVLEGFDDKENKFIVKMTGGQEGDSWNGKICKWACIAKDV